MRGGGSKQTAKILLISDSRKYTAKQKKMHLPTHMGVQEYLSLNLITSKSTRKFPWPKEAYLFLKPCHYRACIPTWFLHAQTHRTSQYTTFSWHTRYYPQWDIFTCSLRSEQKFIVKLSAWAQTNIQEDRRGRKEESAPLCNYKICRQSLLLTIKKWEQV